ncbi:nuclear transport factor 2 family protein [Chelatococcus sp. GCM10030263]|uniref:nuclear transport factor 2 family protein n=1 Tax=Chelatococcus sp. GCM10030263 TaxID=3273387 RepID=UPI0036183F3D
MSTQANIREAVENLIVDFFYHLDTFGFEALVGCMAPDGEWHRQGKILRGHQMILAALAERGTDVRTAHLVTNFHIVSANATSAEARFYMVAYRYDGPISENEPAKLDLPFSIGLYSCRYARAGDSWTIADLRSELRFRR